MNQAHFHLVLNHIPIIMPGVGLLVMLGGYMLKSETVKRTAYSIFILGAIITIPAFLTGEGAEEIIEKVQGIDKQFIKQHERVADTFSILCYVLGGISLVGLWANWEQKQISKIIGLSTVVFSIAVLVFAKQTGTTGGEIRHSEIRPQSADGFLSVPLPESERSEGE
jgi:uncharacterized membrane protein